MRLITSARESDICTTAKRAKSSYKPDKLDPFQNVHPEDVFIKDVPECGDKEEILRDTPCDRPVGATPNRCPHSKYTSLGVRPSNFQ